MLEQLPAQAPDKIIALMGLFKADTRTDKIDLGVGVYKDATGKTPVMASVKAAEKALVEAQESKSYVGLLGDLEFCDVMRDLVLGDAVDASRVASGRVGVMMAISSSEEGHALAKGAMASINRLNYSFPPDHGAKVVQMVLTDSKLRDNWLNELEEMRTSMLGLRTALAEALRRETNSDRFDFVAKHRGMFSRLGLSPEQVLRLREEFGVYMVGDSRVNIAGLRHEIIERLAKSIAAVL